MKNKRIFDFKVDTVIEGSYFSYTVPLPGATSKWYWELDGSDTTQLRMGVQLTGLMSWMYKLVLEKTLQDAFTVCTNNIIEMV